ncbi:Sulfoxide reductase catalytic subunit YedY precursor [Streptomyces sp. ADI96-02]|uniref:molybdopterin-dependent oxidoreductase n=1 Tax=Streptomyces sp. ADI96-02 TaxID=1522760 RepID=UPI000F5575F2|nr:molybdopterin-dependent oxidoreductase [Streptomyces sp. ADI96-02]RPK54520.1 Sulfoxide reductase catalytic subunit YedY precursor [Streptomyces sp. ADI96-02]
MTTTPGLAVRLPLGALSGLLAGFAALAVAELVAAAVRPAAGPITAVGGAAIDRTPTPVKDWAIRHFGENDKTVLQLGILAALVVLAVVLGLVALRFRRVGAAGVLIFGLVGAGAAVSRPDASGWTDALPSVVGAVAGAGLLYRLTGRLTLPPRAAAAPPGPDRAAGWDRRGFVVTASAAAVTSAGVGLLGRYLAGHSSQAAVASREAVRLPAPASPAPPLPAGVQLDVPGLSPFTTSNRAFYRVDTALVVPKVNARAWRLRIHGKGVARPLTVTFEDLLRRELIERYITLTCVSNEVGGPYVGNARWLGAPLSDLLREAGVRPPSRGGPADQLVARSVDGMTLGTPVEDVMDGRDAMLAVGMNGQPLPFTHGFPVRMVVPGLYGYVSACKWIEDIELTTFADFEPYWVKRTWAREAPVKTQSRIDTPKPLSRSRAGTVTVAGVAWAQHRGIERVQVRIDDGPWQEAELAAEASIDTWRQWSFPWRATPGSHTITARATERGGRVQTQKRTGTVPDGASGRPSVVVTVE